MPKNSLVRLCARIIDARAQRRSFLMPVRSQALNIARVNGAANIADAMWTAAINLAISLSYRGL